MPRNRSGLSNRQQAFVEIFCKANGRLTPTECAREAGYSGKSATTAACNLRNPRYYPKVVEAIELKQREYAEASKLDVTKHMREMARLRDMAVENGQFAAAINAEYRRGQAVGLYVDRKEVVTGSLDKMSRPELEAKLKELREGLIVNGEYDVIEDNTTTVEIESER
tara:strand:+ start:1143 stop:1643 length:501 start_codon:yes stop_codon:yes gene_type:complete